MINKKELLYLEKRRQLYNFILKHPGLHLREIFRKNKMSEGTIKYHLKYLKSRDLIIEKKEEGYTRFYVKDKIGNKDKDLIKIMRQKIPRNIVLYIMVNMVSSRVRIAKELNLSPKLVEYHTKKLLEAGIIEQAYLKDGYVELKKHDLPRYKKFKPANNEIIFILKDGWAIYDFFITYKDTFSGTTVIKDIITWIEFLKNYEFPEKTNDEDEKFEEFIEMLLDIFPHPYYGC